MKFAMSVLWVAYVLSWSSLAQVPSIVEGTPFEARPGQWQKVIRNQSPSSLVAFFVAPPHCSYANPGPGVTYDALVYSGNLEIRSGESTEIQTGDPSKCPGSVSAAIFSDGHVEGDPKALDYLYSGRRGAYKALGESIELLNSIRDQHETTQHVIDTMDTKRQANLQQRTETGLGYNLVCHVILTTMRDAHERPRLPSDTGPENPAAIKDVMNSTGLSHEEARAVAFSTRLERWKSLLEKNLQPRR